MKMFKRFAAALLAGVMVLAMLTACGGGAGGPGESEFEESSGCIYGCTEQGIRHRMVQ